MHYSWWFTSTSIYNIYFTLYYNLIKLSLYIFSIIILPQQVGSFFFFEKKGRIERIMFGDLMSHGISAFYFHMYGHFSGYGTCARSKVWWEMRLGSLAMRTYKTFLLLEKFLHDAWYGLFFVIFIYSNWSFIFIFILGNLIIGYISTPPKKMKSIISVKLTLFLL